MTRRKILIDEDLLVRLQTYAGVAVDVGYTGDQAGEPWRDRDAVGALLDQPAIEPTPLVCPHCGATEFFVPTEDRGSGSYASDVVPSMIECQHCDTEWTTEGKPLKVYPASLGYALERDPYA